MKPSAVLRAASRHLAALALPLAVHAQAPAPPDAAQPMVKVFVLSVRAMPEGDGDAMGPGLDRVASKLKRLPFARYEAAGAVEREIAVGETLTVPFDDTGRWLLVPRSDASGAIALEVREFAPGAAKPCLEWQGAIEKARSNITFCDGVPSKSGTLVFVWSAVAITR